MRRALAIALAAALAACAGGGTTAPDLVSLADLAPGVSIDMRYAGSDNFVGAPVDGYEAPVCLLARPAAQALAAVQHDLEAEGLGLRVFDCYRPARAVAHFARWARDLADERTKAAYYPRVEKSRLFELGYIAERSGHSRASTVDLTLVERGGDGTLRELDMGGPFDLFDALSNTDSPDVTPDQRANRVRLRAALERRGFRNLPVEWWHYTLAAEPYPDTYFDVPVAPPPVSTSPTAADGSWGNPSALPPAGPVPDADAAIRVAREAWLARYGQPALRHEPFVAELRGDVWHVSGTLPGGEIGGVPEARIDRNTGATRVRHTR